MSALMGLASLGVAGHPAACNSLSQMYAKYVRLANLAKTPNTKAQYMSIAESTKIKYNACISDPAATTAPVIKACLALNNLVTRYTKLANTAKNPTQKARYAALATQAQTKLAACLLANPGTPVPPGTVTPPVIPPFTHPTVSKITQNLPPNCEGYKTSYNLIVDQANAATGVTIWNEAITKLNTLMPTIQSCAAQYGVQAQIPNPYIPPTTGGSYPGGPLILPIDTGSGEDIWSGGGGAPGPGSPPGVTPIQEQLQECSPDFNSKLPLTYSDPYGEMTVLQVVCGAQAQQNPSANAGAGQIQNIPVLESQELSTLTGYENDLGHNSGRYIG